jgi:hypothetical protein
MNINKHEIVKTGFKPAFIQVEILKMDLVIISLCNLASLNPGRKNAAKTLRH